MVNKSCCRQCKGSESSALKNEYAKTMVTNASIAVVDKFDHSAEENLDHKLAKLLIGQPE
jgi:hypothetical protein